LGGTLGAARLATVDVISANTTRVRFETRYPNLLLSAGAGACSNALAAHPQLFLTAGRSAANPPATDAAVDRRDRQTDGRTDGRTPDRYMDSALHSMLTAPKINTLRVARDVLRNYCGSVDG